VIEASFPSYGGVDAPRRPCPPQPFLFRKDCQLSKTGDIPFLVVLLLPPSHKIVTFSAKAFSSSQVIRPFLGTRLDRLLLPRGEELRISRSSSVPSRIFPLPLRAPGGFALSSTFFPFPCLPSALAFRSAALFHKKAPDTFASPRFTSIASSPSGRADPKTFLDIEHMRISGGSWLSNLGEVPFRHGWLGRVPPILVQENIQAGSQWGWLSQDKRRRPPPIVRIQRVPFFLLPGCDRLRLSFSRTSRPSLEHIEGCSPPS